MKSNPQILELLGFRKNYKDLVLIDKMGNTIDKVTIPSNVFNTLTKSRNSNIIAGFNLIKTSKNKLGYQPLYINKSGKTLTNNGMRRSIFLENDQLIVGTKLITIFNKIDSYIYSEAGIILKKNDIMCLKETLDKTIFIGTVNRLYKVNNYDFKKIEKIELLDSNTNVRISGIEENSNGFIIVSSIGHGLFYKSPTETNFKKLNFTGNYFKGLINCLKFENDTTLWIGSNDGLFRIQLAYSDKLEIINVKRVSTIDGLNSNFIVDLEYWNNKLWIVTPKNLNFFDPNQLNFNSKTPKIFLDSIQVNNKSIKSKKENTFDSHQNDLTFHYTGISFEKPTKSNFYKYQLQHQNNISSWEQTNSRSIQFTNLEHGKYKFIVAAKNRNEEWSENPATFSFEIEPELKDEKWFQVLCLFLLLFFSYLIYKIRERQIITKEKQKSDLQLAEFKFKRAELSALRNQMNPHFIYNALNSIQNFIFQDNPEQANYFLSQFSKLMRSSLEMSKLEYITLTKEINFLKTYLELEQLRFNNKFEYHIIVDHKIPKDLIIPPLIVQPLVENCIKHAFNNLDKKGIIRIEFKIDESQITVMVSDNGHGIKDINKQGNHKIRKSFGLSILKERLEIINEKEQTNIAIIEMKTQENTTIKKGTEVIIKLPIIRDNT